MSAFVCSRCGGRVEAPSPDQTCPFCTALFATKNPAPHDASTRLVAGDSPESADEQASVLADSAVAPFQLLERLGRGGMGEVYRARQCSLDRIVAFKIIHPGRGQEEAFAARFRQEAVLLARLNHPHIVAIYDYGEFQGRPFLAMEFVDGESLRQRLNAGPVEPAQALLWARQLCEALAYAHDLQIIHRDIKPENILITRSGHVKVVDFGLAKLVDRSGQHAGLTGDGAIMGTFRYMPPEQLAGSTSLDARVDVYAIGVVLYEMLTGTQPQGRFPPPSQVANVDPQLDNIVLQALESDRRRRYSNAAEMRKALESVSAAAHPPNVAPTQAQVRRVLGGLPGELTSFIGRDRECREIRELLYSSRLVTLTGPGGTGKTRLALQVAEELVGQFPHGVWFVPLGEFTDSTLALAATARILGVRENAKSVEANLQEHLRDKQMLVVLDNFEQLASAAQFVTRLLDMGSELRIIVTSRVPLHLRGEREFAVPTMAVPTASSATPNVAASLKSPAVQLFVQRARAVRGDFELNEGNVVAVESICRRLDGLPLAIELAAARVKMLSPEALAARLSNQLKVLTGGSRDLPARQQTLRGAIAWSYELLTPSQRTLFAWLSTFVGSFSVEEAEQLVTVFAEQSPLPLPPMSEPFDPSEMLDEVTALADHSLLRCVASDPAPRFDMLGAIREFGTEQLAAGQCIPVARTAHARWCEQFMVVAEKAIAGPKSEVTFRDWLPHRGDMRSAIEWLLGEGNAPGRAQTLAGRCWYFWILDTAYTEGFEHLQAVSRRSELMGDHPDRSRVLHGLGTIATSLGRTAEAWTAFESALEIRRRSEGPLEVAATLNNFANLARGQGRFSEAIAMHEEALQRRRSQGDPRQIAMSLTNMALVLTDLGHAQRALPLLEEAYAIFNTLGDVRNAATTLSNLARAEYGGGDRARGALLFRKLVELRTRMDDRRGLIVARLGLSTVEIDEGRLDAARELLDEVDLALHEVDDPWLVAGSAHARGRLELECGHFTSALERTRLALRQRLPLHDVAGVTELLAQMVRCCAALDDPQRAFRARCAERNLRQRNDALAWPREEEILARVTDELRGRLGQETCERIERETSSWSFEQICQWGLAEA